MEQEMATVLVWVFVNMIDAIGVEGGRAALDSMHLVSL
jgi:hypothetical protein